MLALILRIPLLLAALIISAMTIVSPFASAQSSATCNQCDALANSALGCDFNYQTESYPTLTEIACMCIVDNFMSQYTACMDCLVSGNYITSTERAQLNAAVESTCSGVTVTSSSATATALAQAGASSGVAVSSQYIFIGALFAMAIGRYFGDAL